MNIFLNGLLHDWNLMRILRIVIGFSAIMEGLSSHSFFYGIIGAFFLWQGLNNTGCGSSSCSNN
jgi:hypothetical protein